MLTKDKLSQICTFPNTIEKIIIKTLYEEYSGACHIDTLSLSLPNIDRNKILMHIRKSIFMVRDKKTAIVKLIRKPDPRQGSVYGRLYDCADDATNVQDYCFSIYWRDIDLKPAIVNNLVSTFAKNNGINAYTFLTNKNIRETIKKGVKKFQMAQ